MNQIQCNRCKVLVVDASDDWLLAKKKVCNLCAAIYFSIFSFSCDQYLFLQSNLLSQNIVAALGLLS